ncbi:MAG: hypothetical protein AAF733_06000, partial [Verrucomicrobiota bacterium]
AKIHRSDGEPTMRRARSPGKGDESNQSKLEMSETFAHGERRRVRDEEPNRRSLIESALGPDMILERDHGEVQTGENFRQGRESLIGQNSQTAVMICLATTVEFGLTGMGISLAAGIESNDTHASRRNSRAET